MLAVADVVLEVVFDVVFEVVVVVDIEPAAVLVMEAPVVDVDADGAVLVACVVAAPDFFAGDFDLVVAVCGSAANAGIATKSRRTGATLRTQPIIPSQVL